MEDRKQLREAHRGFSAFQFDKEANADTGRSCQLILAEALRKPSLTDDGANLLDGHGDVPDREYSASFQQERPAVFPIGIFLAGGGERGTSVRRHLKWLNLA